LAVFILPRKELDKLALGGLDWEGIGANYATFQADSALADIVAASGVAAVKGKAVAITGSGGVVGFGNYGDPLLGRIDKYEYDGYVGVQYQGFAWFPGVSGSLPAPGAAVVVNGSGAVVASAGAGGPARAISVDSVANRVMVLIG